MLILGQTKISYFFYSWFIMCEAYYHFMWYRVDGTYWIWSRWLWRKNWYLSHKCILSKYKDYFADIFFMLQLTSESSLGFPQIHWYQQWKERCRSFSWIFSLYTWRDWDLEICRKLVISWKTASISTEAFQGCSQAQTDLCDLWHDTKTL